MTTLFDLIETADIEWRDGLPYSSQFGDIYFSKDAGILETEYVFIDGNNLPTRWSRLPKRAPSQFVIAEMGFGTGLNFLVTWQAWRKWAPKNARLHYISCEKHPLSKENLARCIALWPSLSHEGNSLLELYPVLTPGMHHLEFEEQGLSLTLLLGDATKMYQDLVICGDAVLESELRQWSVDAWFLDGFAPSKNHEMWQDNLFQIIALLSKQNTTLSTYSAASVVKTNLSKHGFDVHKTKGFGQKRHMLKACFNGVHHSLKQRETPWFISRPESVAEKKVIVLGAGLSGAFCAHEFAKRGYQVVLLEQLSAPGLGASANPQAVLFPNISSYRSPLTELMLYGFLYAARRYSSDLKLGVQGEFHGLLQLLYREEEEQSATKMRSWLSHYPELAKELNSDQSSKLAGIKIDVPALYVPLAGWLNSSVLCAYLVDDANIHFFADSFVDELFYLGGLWHLGKHSAPTVVVASGWASNQFSQLRDLPMNSIRGQMSAVPKTVKSSQLTVPICAASHLLPAYDGLHYCGASYHLSDQQTLSRARDDKENIDKLNALPIEAIFDTKVVKSWAAVRGATPNYLPMVGPVPIGSQFKMRFDALKKNAKSWIAQEGSYYPGLYICAGFGSRGLTTVPLCAHWLVSSINAEPSMLPRHLIKAISPARFILKDLLRSKI